MLACLPTLLLTGFFLVTRDASRYQSAPIAEASSARDRRQVTLARTIEGRSRPDLTLILRHRLDAVRAARIHSRYGQDLGA